MIFPSEKKKELWRYALRNSLGPCDGAPAVPAVQPPRPPPPPHRPRPHLCSGYSCDEEEEDSLAMRQQTPPPPYSSMSCAMDCSGSNSGSYCHSLSLSHHHNNNNNNNSHPYRRLPNHKDPLPPQPPPPPSASDRCCTAPGCSCASSCDDMLIDGSDQERSRERERNPVQVQQVDRRMLSATTFATMFRNCCGGASESTTSGSTPTIPVTTAHQPQNQVQNVKRIREEFDALMKQLKRKQMAELLLAIKSRVDPPTRTQRDAGVTGASTAPTYLQCILIPSATQADREQHVTASRLFFWAGLRSGEELKRLPVCPAAFDSIYTCCNPLHWFRILHQPDSGSIPITFFTLGGHRSLL